MLDQRMLCTYCGSETSSPLRVAPGSGWVAGALALCFIVPGVIYTVWRYTCQRTVCPTCRHASLIPADAPLARTWLHSGWIPRRMEPASGSVGAETRLERIELAVDAIAVEVERLGEAQRLSARLLSEQASQERLINNR